MAAMRAQTAPGACTGCSQQIAPEEAQVRFPECDTAFHWDCFFDETMAKKQSKIEKLQAANARLRAELRAAGGGRGGSGGAGGSRGPAAGGRDPGAAPAAARHRVVICDDSGDEHPEGRPACAGCRKLAADLASTQEDNGIALDFQAQAEARVEQLEAELESVRQQLRAQRASAAAGAPQQREPATRREQAARLKVEIFDVGNLDAQQLADLLDELDDAKRVVDRQLRRAAEDLVAATPSLHAFLCPIGLQLMRHPVMAADDHTYERAQIERWIREKGRGVQSPKTNAVLAHTRLQSNHAVKTLIDDAVETKLREMREARARKKRKRPEDARPEEGGRVAAHVFRALGARAAAQDSMDRT
jgi:hypothetical protein